MHFSLSMDAALSALTEIALTLQELTQGRLKFMIALYGQTLAHAPHSTHLVLSMWATWFSSSVIAPRRQTSSQRCARQPRQALVTS